MSDWIAAADAYRQVLARVVLPEIASKEILTRIQTGTIVTKAESLRLGGKEQTDALVPLAFWSGMWRTKPRVDFEKGAVISFTFNANGKKTSTDVIAGLQLYRDHVFAIWPPKEGENRIPAAPGRPRDTSYSAQDAKFLPEIIEAKRSGNAKSLTEAAALVVKREGRNVVGIGTDDAKIRRLVSAARKQMSAK